MKRKDVYNLIDEEREYQIKKWDYLDVDYSKNHSIGDWFIYIEDYVNQAKRILSREKAPELKTMDIMRKIAALSIAAIEYNNSRSRSTEEKEKIQQKFDFQQQDIEW